MRSARRYTRWFPISTAPPASPARTAMVQSHGDSVPNVRATTSPAADAQASVSNPTMARITNAARRSQRHLAGTLLAIEAESLQPQELVAQDSRAESAHGQLHVVLQGHDVRPARHRTDLEDEVHIGERAARQAHEPRGIQARFQVLESIRDRVALVRNRRDLQELAVGDDRRDLVDRDDHNVIAPSDGYTPQVPRGSADLDLRRDRLEPIGLRGPEIGLLKALVRAVQRG